MKNFNLLDVAPGITPPVKYDNSNTVGLTIFSIFCIVVFIILLIIILAKSVDLKELKDENEKLYKENQELKKEIDKIKSKK